MGDLVATGDPSPAPPSVLFAWGLALTPVAGLTGFFLGITIFNYGFWHPAPPPHYHYEPQRAPWLDELAALVGFGLFTSLFSWPVTLVVFPLVRGRFPDRTWRALLVVALSGLVMGLLGPVPALLFFALVEW